MLCRSSMSTFGQTYAKKPFGRDVGNMQLASAKCHVSESPLKLKLLVGGMKMVWWSGNVLVHSATTLSCYLLIQCNPENNVPLSATQKLSDYNMWYHYQWQSATTCDNWQMIAYRWLYHCMIHGFIVSACHCNTHPQFKRKNSTYMLQATTRHTCWDLFVYRKYTCQCQTNYEYDVFEIQFGQYVYYIYLMDIAWSLVAGILQGARYHTCFRGQTWCSNTFAKRKRPTNSKQHFGNTAKHWIRTNKNTNKAACQ